MNARTLALALFAAIVASPQALVATDPQPSSRTWADSSGKYRVTATLVKVDAGHAWLRKQSGVVKQVPLEKLSEEDRRFATEQAGSENANLAEAATGALRAMQRAAGAPAFHDGVRQWIDNSGRFQTEASLVAADDAKVTLQKPGGRLVDVPFARLSDRDRAFVRNYLEQWSDSKGLVPPIARQALPQVTELIEGEAPMPITAPDEVRVRLGRAYLDRRFSKPIDKKSPVRDVILGTPVRGESDIHGKVRILPRQSEDRATLLVEVTGKAHSRTVGTHPPVWIHSGANTTFRGTKRLIITPEGIEMKPAGVTSQTRSYTTGISTSLPGLRGRIARRIATRRVEESRSQADRISTQHNRIRIAKDIDRQVAESIERTDKFLSEQQDQLRAALGLEKMDVASRSTDEYIEFCFGNSPDLERTAPPEFTGETDVEIVMHAPGLGGVLDDNARMLFTNLANAMLDRLLERRAENQGTAELSCRLVWSRDQHWLTVIATAEPTPLITQRD